VVHSSRPFAIGWFRVGPFALGGWVTVALLLGFALLAWTVVQRERKPTAG
jgi:hypothetical protein